MIDRILDRSNSEEVVWSEDLAKLGDPLANFIYSLSVSAVKGEPDGDKVSNDVLSNALSNAGLRDLAPSRVDKHRLGDFAEAVIAFAWLKGKLNIDEAVSILCDSLEGVNFENRGEVFQAGERGFENLLKTISERVEFD